jgi:hypothetical protein
MKVEYKAEKFGINYVLKERQVMKVKKEREEK